MAATVSSCGAAMRTAAGTTLVKDILPGTISSELRDLTVFKGALFFAANDGQRFDSGGATVRRPEPQWSEILTPTL